MASYTFTNELWLWQSNGGTAWTFITVPQDVSDEIESSVPTKGGFGSVKVDVAIGSSEWSTSLFPSTEYEAYVLPIKKPVRDKQKLSHGDHVEVTLTPVFAVD
ncbi:MAG: DUF1905 domain-containing protein [Acidimicrobiia bacterium]